MNKAFKFALSLLVGLVVFLIVMAKVGVDNIGKAFTLFFNIQGLIIILLSILMGFFSVLRWKFVLKQQGDNFSLRQLSPLWLIGFCMTYLTPFAVVGGEIFRIYFTRKKFPELSAKKAISSVFTDKLLDITMFFFFLVIGLVIFAFYGPLPTSFLGMSIFFIVFCLILLLSVFYIKSWKKESAIEWLMNIIGMRKRFMNSKNGELVLEAEKETIKFFRSKHVFYGFFLSFLRALSMVLRTVVLIFFLTGNFEILKGLAVFSFTNLASLAPLPATLGALELGQGFSFGVLGFSFAKGTVFGMVLRGANLMLCLFGAIYMIKYGVEIFKEKIFKFFER